jgi:hypothetical protein
VHTLLSLLLLAACGSGDAPPSGDADRLDTAPTDTEGDETGAPAPDSGDTGSAEPRPDPFAPQEDDEIGLVNVSADLEQLLEHGTLLDACDAWEADRDDRRKLLRCGKAMFFYEGFGTDGIPSPIVDFVGTHFEDEVGLAFAGLGMIPDPYSEEGRAIGFGEGAPLEGSMGVDTLSMTCAACHFAQLPDGRYAAGAPNHAYDYGGHLLTLLLVPQAANPLFDAGDHDPEALARVQPLLDRLDADMWLQLTLLWDLLPMLTAMGSFEALDATVEGQYASWAPGTMDFLIAPVPLDDEVHTVTRTLPLWGMPSEDEIAAAGMPHAMLGWTGGTESLLGFLRGFVTYGGGDISEWPDERLEPLVAYLLSLRAPENPDAETDAPRLARGKELFFEAGCADCHGGPRGGGVRVYTFEEVGTDDRLRAWGDPDLDGELCCGLADGGDVVATHGVKAPRLVGLWTNERLLHNGSVTRVEELLCLEGSRPTAGTEPGFGDGGHTFGCELSEEERGDLIAFLGAI